MTRAAVPTRVAAILAASAAALHPLAAQQRGDPPRTADLVLRNGTVYTLDPARPSAEAVAVQGDRIVAVGAEADVRPWIGPTTRVIDLAGRTAIPGFIESHGHFLSLGRARTILDLTRARSWEEIVAMVAEAARAARPGEWILGRGWHQEKWTSTPQPNVDGVPYHHELSRASPRNPVLLTHASGHAAFANALALERAGITRTTPDPPGGQIVRDPRTGEPTGLLRETAQGLVARVQARDAARRPAAEREAEARRHAELAAHEALSKGITTFHDAGSGFETIDLFRRLADEGKLPLRLYVMVRAPYAELEAKLPAYRMIGYGGNRLTVRAIKVTADGALGSHGAWLLEPYTDLPSSTGLPTTPPEEIRRVAELAIRHGFQLNVHAIGDRANREVLDVFEATFRAHPDRRDLRWRIEHAQHLDPADIPRFARLGVIASMQGIHATSDGPWVVRRLGETRARNGAYVWRRLLDSGAVVANGTDAPVEDVDPIASFYATVSRRMANGESFYREHAMSREEALRSYTLAGAYAAFEEELKGSITPGKLADIVVLSRNILTIPEEEIPQTRVEYTIVGGKVVYERGRGVVSDG